MHTLQFSIDFNRCKVSIILVMIASVKVFNLSGCYTPLLNVSLTQSNALTVTLLTGPGFLIPGWPDGFVRGSVRDILLFAVMFLVQFCPQSPHSIGLGQKGKVTIVLLIKSVITRTKSQLADRMSTRYKVLEVYFQLHSSYPVTVRLSWFHFARSSASLRLAPAYLCYMPKVIHILFQTGHAVSTQIISTSRQKSIIKSYPNLKTSNSHPYFKQYRVIYIV